MTCGAAAVPPTATSAAQPEWARRPSAAGRARCLAHPDSLVHGGRAYYACVTRPAVRLIADRLDPRPRDPQPAAARSRRPVRTRPGRRRDLRPPPGHRARRRSSRRSSPRRCRRSSASCAACPCTPGSSRPTSCGHGDDADLRAPGRPLRPAAHPAHRHRALPGRRGHLRGRADHDPAHRWPACCRDWGRAASCPWPSSCTGDLFSLRERARIQGLFSAVWGVASLAGPILGAALTVTFGWRSIFSVNLPARGARLRAGRDQDDRDARHPARSPRRARRPAPGRAGSPPSSSPSCSGRAGRRSPLGLRVALVVGGVVLLVLFARAAGPAARIRSSRPSCSATRARWRPTSPARCWARPSSASTPSCRSSCRARAAARRWRRARS